MSAFADNLPIGKALYNVQCTSCHGQPPRLTDNAGRGANNTSEIQRAISRNSGGMGCLSTMSSTDLADVAAYLGNYAAVPSTSTTQNERLFNWAEYKWQSLLIPRATTQTISQYAVRNYATTSFTSAWRAIRYICTTQITLGGLAGFLASAAGDGF